MDSLLTGLALLINALGAAADTQWSTNDTRAKAAQQAPPPKAPPVTSSSDQASSADADRAPSAASARSAP